MMFSTVKRIFRRLASAPGFTLIAVTTLALGISANTSIFGVANGVILVDVGTTGPSTYVTVSLVLAATALLACAIPAIRAARLDPAHTLREE